MRFVRPNLTQGLLIFMVPPPRRVSVLGARQRHRVFAYLLNTANCLDCREDAAYKLTSWISENAKLLQFDAGWDLVSPPKLHRYSPGSDLTPRVWSAVRGALRDAVQATRRARPDLTRRRLLRLADTAGLSRVDIQILEFLLLHETDPLIASLVDDLVSSSRGGRCMNVAHPMPSMVLNLSYRTVLARFGPHAPLVRTGLVSVDYDGDLTLARRVHRLALVPDSGADVKELLLGTPDRAELAWSDFAHIADDRDHIERILCGALRTGETGVNILLYGPPGTGKTQFCRSVAERLGVPLFSVGEDDDDGAEPTRKERLGDLGLTQALLRTERASLILFDEMVDLLPQSDALPFISGPYPRRGIRATGSKLFVNRLLETAPVPTLWTANTGDPIPAALLRRMKFTLELRLPPPRVRARIWSRQLARNGIEADPDETLALATSFAAPPGVAAQVTEAARLAGGDLASVRRGLGAMARALGCEKAAGTSARAFDLTLLRSELDLVSLADRLETREERRLSMCLQGPPGTGKSACVRYLADRLGLEVLHKRASDLLSPWVGGTEQNIAGAFREALDDQAFLVFDEADSLLADRRHAVRNWEVSQTNEMLTWMESHPLPFACTTNFGDHLDPATLRRFVFKVALDYLDQRQVRLAFRAFFDLDATDDVRQLSNLTPGDFEVVRRKADILGCLRDPKALARLLREECDAKPERRRPIGFRGGSPGTGPSGSHISGSPLR